MNLGSRKGGVKASRFYGLVFVALTGVLGVVSPPDLGLMVAEAQTVKDRKAEADRLFYQGVQQFQTSKFESALQLWQQALTIYREIKDRLGEGATLVNLGIAYESIGKYDKVIEFHLQRLELVREIKDRLGEGQALGNLGIAYYRLGKSDKAIEFHLQALIILREIKNLQAEQSILGSLGSLGIAYYSLSKYDKAIEYFQQALENARKLGDRNIERISLSSLGNTYDRLKQYQQSIDYYQQSLEIARQINDLNNQRDTLNRLGIGYGNLNQYEKAINFFQQSLAIANQLGDTNGVKAAMRNLGRAYSQLRQYQKAINSYQQSLVIARQTRDLNGEADSLSGLGNSYYSLSQYQKAIDYHQQSLVLFRKIGYLSGEAESLRGLGISYYSLSQYQKAIDYHQQSLAIAKKIADVDLQESALGNLATVYIFLGQDQKAIDLYQQAIVNARQIRNNSEVIWLNNLGITFSNLGQYKKAVDYFNQSLAIVKEYSDPSVEGSLLGNLGYLYGRLGEYQTAIDFHQRSLMIFKQIGNRQDEGVALIGLGHAYNVLGKYQQAVDFYQQSLGVFKQIKDRTREHHSLSYLGLTFKNLNQSEVSILFYKQSVNVTESIRKGITKLVKEDQRFYLETVERSYRRLTDLLLKQGRIMEALQVLDLLKVQELEDYFKNIKGSDRSAQGVRLLEPEKAISEKLLAVNFDNSKEINSQLANQIQQLPKSEINKVPDYLQKIPQGTALLYPLILDDRLEIILFSPNTIPISRTVKISQKELETLVIDFRAALLDAGSEDVKEPAAQLYKLLIKPIEAELIQAKATTILYAPDGILRYIPIAALYDGKQWLAEKYQISNLIAYSLFDFSAQPKNSPNILAGAFGGKAGEKKHGQNALPATLTEVKAIANSFQNSVILTEEAFSRQAIESKFKNHNVLHLATHAEFNTGAPDKSFIIFGNGDKIRLGEITDWQIPNIELIVLSACQTGVGKLGDGVEILGFGYQVQKAGAKQAIASLWKVDDAGTQALMVAFYQELQKGDVTVTEALRRAQVSLIKSPNFNHPNYWSAFFAIGNGL
ncbi:CHAT domain-containing protein [Phormidium tenue]